MANNALSLSSQAINEKLDSLFFLSSLQKTEKIVFFIDTQHKIEQIILKTNQPYFTGLSIYSKKPFTEALTYMGLDANDIPDLIKKAKTTLFEHSEFHDKNLSHEYMLSIAYTGSNYVVIFTLIDRKNEALKAYINTIINTLPGAIYWKDKEGRYMGCNQSVANMAGFDHPEHVIGKTDFDLCWKEFAQDWRNLDLDVMRENKTYKREEIAKLADGRIITELTIKSPLYNEKKEIVGVIGTSMDITEQKNLEQDLIAARQKAEAASLAKTEFLENMRHDIRTPLTGIVGFADILKMEADSPHIKEYAENLIASSHALLDLLDEVLEAIRVSSGEIPKLKKKFSLYKTLENIIKLNRAKAAHKNLDLSLDIDTNIPAYVIGDKVRVHRIILELIANALNFTDFGFVKLSAHLAKRNNRELIIKLIVEDSGIGIPQDKQQEIYLQFKRLTPSYQGLYKGAGLGLSVVKQFIDELEGEIYVKSAPRKGSRFTCVIPLQEPLLDDDLGVDEELEKALDAPYQTTYAEQIRSVQLDDSKKQYQVLVVEDNPIAQSIATSLLTSLNCNVDIAETGKKAIEQWKTNPYDLIFMDIGLPDLDGYEVTHLIRVQELPKKTHTPIIALTAHVGEENKKRCIDAGMNAVINKPLTAKNCADIVATFIPGRKQEEMTQEIARTSNLSEENANLFNLTEFPILDPEEGINTTGSEAMLAEMLTIMVNESLPNDLELMKKAHDENDWGKTQQIAHKIKGGAVYVGTVKINIACQHLEQYWKTGQRELLEKLYQQLLRVINESIKEIKSWLASH
ncbi:response regulator [Legionella hackeliae]|uniref:histidine kinase n=1 Tax=Legionella hackeliae TaxID=449 RepID=A0A0A8UWP6_LEGHA|nr:response regulator [Legionella hackeliae]KTD15466.1 sensory histidine-kinase / response regulator [Legionella hackeliae]CEK11164.1 putative sensory box sensor histidine kinase/response regulator [Legionella hackeliae]STX47928.1 sensory histidine-kinase / response regulator [Legionella hackeliae]